MNRQMKRNLIAAAKEEFKDWDINLTKYKGEVIYTPKAVTCKIVLEHIGTGVLLVLNDVFFTPEGRILQCVHSFR